MKRYIDSITNKKFDLNIPDIVSVIYILTVFGIIASGRFDYNLFYQLLFAVTAVVLLILELRSEDKPAKITTISNIIISLLFITILEIILVMSGGGLFPAFYLLLPVFYGIFGVASVIICIIYVSAIQILTLELYPAVISVLILTFITFLFGPMLKSNFAGYRYLFTDNRDLDTGKPSLEYSVNIGLDDIDTYKTEVRASMNFLGKLIDHNSIILYIKNEEGLFEIYDYISNTPDAIDSGQKLLFRSGYINWLTKTNSSIVIDEIKNLRENAVYYTKTVDIKSLMAVPLKNQLIDTGSNRTEVKGILVVDNYNKNAFNENDRELAELVADKIYSTLVIERLQKNVSDSGDELTSLYDYIQKLESNMDVEKIINHLLSTLVSTIPNDLTCITLNDPDKNESTIKAVSIENENLVNHTFSNTNSLVGLVTESGKPLSFLDVSDRSKFRTVFDRGTDFVVNVKNLKSTLILPIVTLEEENETDREILGTVYMSRKRKLVFNEEQKNLATVLTQQAAKAITYSINLRRINELAIKDGLSSLYNHRHFKEMLSNIVARAVRYSEDLSLILIDVDNFKMINDEHGHQAGDIIISEIGKIISESIREIDIAARYGGDEFAIVLPKTNESGSMYVAEKLEKKIDSSRILNTDKLKVTFSIGISSFPKNAMTRDGLIEKADIALYVAKDRGKNQTVHYNDIEPEIQQSDKSN